MLLNVCAIELPNGTLSISRDDILGKSREENIVMARAIWKNLKNV